MSKLVSHVYVPTLNLTLLKNCNRAKSLEPIPTFIKAYKIMTLYKLIPKAFGFVVMVVGGIGKD